MTPLARKFADLRARGEKALVLFVTAGDPTLEDLPSILDALAEGGADVVEVGIPFSDPFGEGPTIQGSSQRALDAGASPRAILEALGRTDLRTTTVTMGYYNPILRYGLREFAHDEARAGVSGTIISDLVPDEADAWCRSSEEAGIDTIFLVAPTSSDARIRDVAARSTGFVYVVSRTGVTGSENAVPTDVTHLVQRVRSLTDRPVCVGFGVSTPDHVRMVCEYADGAVVGSALVGKIGREWNGGKGRAAIVEFVRSLKQATRPADAI